MEAARSKGAKKKGADSDELQQLIDRHNTHLEKISKVRKRLEKNLISINQVSPPLLPLSSGAPLPAARSLQVPV
jgi:hypothetical protein